MVLQSVRNCFPTQHVDSQHLKCVSKGERSTLFFQASAIFNIKLEMQWGGVCLTRSNVVVVVVFVVFLCLIAGRSTMGVNIGGLLNGM